MAVHSVALFPGLYSLKSLKTSLHSHPGVVTDLHPPLLTPSLLTFLSFYFTFLLLCSLTLLSITLLSITLLSLTLPPSLLSPSPFSPSPFLPHPSLPHSLFSLPCSLQPLLSPEELEQTKATVKEFGREGGAGEKLQQALLERAKNHENWVGGGFEGWRVGGLVTLRMGG